MKVYDATSIRNIAVVGHGGSGKTQLVSAMLFVAGAVNRMGKVDDGSTVTDFDDEEIAAATPSPPASPTPNGRRLKSTSSIRQDLPTFSVMRAPHCAWSR